MHLYCNMFLSLSFFFSCLLFVPEIVAISLFALVQRNVFIPFELFFSSLSFTNVFELLQDYLNHNRPSLLSFFYYYKIIDSLLLPSIFARANVSTNIYSNAHWFSLRTSSSSSGVKSFLMLNVLRISAGVFPLIIFATVWQHKSSKSLMSK